MSDTPRRNEGRMEPARQHSILLVEDNPADVKIMQRALPQAASGVELVVVRDGQEAVDYLLREGPFVRRPISPATPKELSSDPLIDIQPIPWRRPDLVVLDLNLPRLTGIEVLKRLRETPSVCLTPVVVMSTSSEPEDVREAYAAGANTYIEKPHDFERFVEVLRTTLQFWLATAVPPPSSVG